MNKSCGFTLIETLVAMAILASALMVLSMSWSGTFMRLRKTQQNFEVASLLERKMSELESLYQGKTVDSIKEEEEGDFGSDYPEYKWKMVSQKLVLPDIASSLTAQDNGANTLLVSVIKQMTDNLSQSVKEIKLTVIHTGKNKKPVEYTITTYFVDYDREIQMGLPAGGL